MASLFACALFLHRPEGGELLERRGLILGCSELHLQWRFLMSWQSPLDRIHPLWSNGIKAELIGIRHGQAGLQWHHDSNWNIA
jgi:hypothetical protein